MDGQLPLPPFLEELFIYLFASILGWENINSFKNPDTDAKITPLEYT